MLWFLRLIVIVCGVIGDNGGGDPIDGFDTLLLVLADAFNALLLVAAAISVDNGESLLLSSFLELTV